MKPMRLRIQQQPRLFARLLALLLTIALLVAAPNATRIVRVEPAQPKASAAAPITFEHAVSSSSEALVRIAAAPLLERLPFLAALEVSPRARKVAWSTADFPSELRAPRVTAHFHQKRRIPRMNSEEPPRA